MPAVDGQTLPSVARSAGQFANTCEKIETKSSREAIKNSKIAPYIRRPVLVVAKKLRFLSCHRKVVQCIALIATNLAERTHLVATSHVDNVMALERAEKEEVL